jgi:putative flippase GtrA
VVDVKTNGKAGQIQRALSYLFFGGSAAVVNLVVLVIASALMPKSLDSNLSVTIAYIIAAECSIMANFLPNDRFTFNSLPGAKRPWIQRCLRFHATAIVGTLLTYILLMILKNFAHLPNLIAEAIAIIIVLVYNFTFHNLFTYGKKKEKH